MSELKTKVTDASVKKLLDGVEPAEKRQDALALLEIFTKVTGEKAVMWGDSIVGFGSYHYKSERSKQEGDWMRTGFSPRKQNLTVYIMDCKRYAPLLEKLGKHKTSDGGCVYINKLADVDKKVLAEIIRAADQYMKKTYPSN